MRLVSTSRIPLKKKRAGFAIKPARLTKREP